MCALFSGVICCRLFTLLHFFVCAVAVISFTYMISLDWIHPGWTAFCSCWPSPWSDLWFSCWKLKWYWPYYWTKSMWLAPCPWSHKHTHLIPRDCYVAQWWLCVCVRARVVGCECCDGDAAGGADAGDFCLFFLFSFVTFLFLVTCFTASASAASSSSSPLSACWNWIVHRRLNGVCGARGAETRGKKRERASSVWTEHSCKKSAHKLYRTLFEALRAMLWRLSVDGIVVVWSGCARVYCRWSVCCLVCHSSPRMKRYGRKFTHTLRTESWCSDEEDNNLKDFLQPQQANWDQWSSDAFHCFDFRIVLKLFPFFRSNLILFPSIFDSRAKICWEEQIKKEK